MEPVLCFPAPVATALQKVLVDAGYDYLEASSAEEAARQEPTDGWTAVLVSAGEHHEDAFSFARAVRQREGAPAPILLLVEQGQLAELGLHEETFDDFIVAPISADELDARIGHLLFRTGRGKHHDVIVYGPLALNLETYQAVIGGRPLDLTFMEYELLRFLAAHPGNVFTREVLLSRVWGYEYFGGARTVDVHIRRLRAKLGEEHAHLIDTVRSVGYRFGKARWAP
ncbi:MAG TPA: response regulator transcription factor [Acidimicrobiales bacterium]|nr:response regulator transcription factor [Acidimicrobiales bacterium]